MYKLSEIEERTLDRILDININIYNCYMNMARLDSFGLKNSCAFNRLISLISNNRRDLSILFEKLDICSSECFDAYLDYVCNKCAECNVLQIIEKRILFQLENEFILIDPRDEDDFIDEEFDEDMDCCYKNELINENEKEVEQHSDYLIQLFYFIVMVDFDFVYNNELRKYFDFDEVNNVIFNKLIYDDIYSRFSLEEELVQNGFNFNRDKYLYGELRSELLFRIRDDFSSAIDFDEVYDQAIFSASLSHLGKYIKMYSDNSKNFIYRVYLIVCLVSIFIMMDISNIEEFVYIFEESYPEFCDLLTKNDEYKSILDEAFSLFKKEKNKYKKLVLV